ncbi:hypothetical protein NEFER03_0717 [Nematocida sp. LUAm3]|nr:hypothetical protein NEFER03_0717 [Nematocida sp. LUAm3]
MQEQSIRIQSEKKKKEEEEKSSIMEIKEELKEILKETEGYLVNEIEITENTLISTISKVDTLLERIGKIDSSSEHRIIEKHSFMSMSVHALILCKALRDSSEADKKVLEIDEKYRINMLNNNLKVCEGEIRASKGVFAESFYVGLRKEKNKSITKKVEMLRMLKMKKTIKERVEGKEDVLLDHMVREACGVIENEIHSRIPITKQTTYEEICEIMEGVIETENIRYMEGVIAPLEHSLVISEKMQDNSSLNPSSVLLRLSVIEAETESEEKERRNTLSCLMLRTVANYMNLRRKSGIKGKDLLECLFEEEEIEIMIRALSKDIPKPLELEVLNILVEGEVPLEKIESITVNTHNLSSLIRYILLNPEASEALLFKVINSLDMEFLEEEEREEQNPLLILDFLTEILKNYLKRKSENSLSFQKYLSSQVLDLYNALVLHTTNPLLVTSYLAFLSALIGADHQYAPHASPIQRNLILHRSINSIIAAVRNISTFLIQEDTVYVEAPSLSLEDTHLNIQRSFSHGVSLLFNIMAELPDQLKVAAASRYLMYILFRSISSPLSISTETLFFIKELFCNRAVIQKISVSTGTHFFLMISLLIAKGELTAVEEIISRNQMLYKGIFYHGCISSRTVKEFKQKKDLYSLLSSLFVYYYAYTPKADDETINKVIIEVFSSVIYELKNIPNITTEICDSKEFSYFFKASSVLSRHLPLGADELLSLMLRTQNYLKMDQKKASLDILYKCTSKQVAESYFFYYFVLLGEILLVDEKVGGRSILGELSNPFTTPSLKYIALLGLTEQDAPRSSDTLKLFTRISLMELSQEERVLFTNQIYRGLFLNGCVVEEATLKDPLYPQKNALGYIGKEKEKDKEKDKDIRRYSHCDMLIRSAIKATEDSGTPYTLPLERLSSGSPPLISAFLYTLYTASPNSAVILSYIKKARNLIRDDDSVFTRVLAIAVRNNAS